MGNTGIAAFLKTVGFLKSNPSGFFRNDLLNGVFVHLFSSFFMLKLSGNRLTFSNRNLCGSAKLVIQILFCFFLILPEQLDCWS